jgi:hypothetical protein
MASPMEALNASQTAFPDQLYDTMATAQSGIVSKVLENMSVTSTILTLLLLAITYDQRKSH